MLERARPQASAYGHTGRSIFLVFLLLALSLTAVASAYAQAAQRYYEIPAQPLADAVTAFGQQSGAQISAPSGLLAGRTSAAIKGNFSMTEALARLLARTGVTFSMQGATIVLQSALASATAEGAHALGTLQVEGQGGPHAGPIGGGNANRPQLADRIADLGGSFFVSGNR
jgi:hypothetical protein